MKNFCHIIALLFVALLFAQNKNSAFDNLVQAEMKSASKFKNLVTNSNTQNYDVTYHKLEWTVNPAVYFISGKVTTTYTALANMSTITSIWQMNWS